MSGARQDQNEVSRRRFIAGAAAAAAGGAYVGLGAGGVARASTGRPVPRVVLGGQPYGLPPRQFAWVHTLRRDGEGNPVAPRRDRLLFFHVEGDPTPAYARVLEAALRTLERTFSWGPAGLLFTASWGPDYFEQVVGARSPVPRAQALSAFELPAIDDYHLCLHLAADDEARLAAVEAALVHGARLHGAKGALDLSSILRWRESRTGFIGAGLPAAHQRVGGIPHGSPVPAPAPLFMGFRSNLRRNQATEESVTIDSGPFAEGSTMHVSYMRLRLDSWYGGLSERERVARMYAPQVTPEQVRHFTSDAPGDPRGYEQAVRRYGVVGHAQTSARARRHGRPRIIRRDFSTVDGGQAGLHFVALQRTIDDFVITRTAMNATGAQLQNPSIAGTTNNGINEFIVVLKRANYVIPSRRDRSFPLLPGRGRALA